VGAPLALPDDHIAATVAQVLRLGMSLAAVPENGNGLVLEQGKVGVVVVVDGDWHGRYLVGGVGFVICQWSLKLSAVSNQLMETSMAENCNNQACSSTASVRCVGSPISISEESVLFRARAIRPVRAISKIPKGRTAS